MTTIIREGPSSMKPCCLAAISATTITKADGTTVSVRYLFCPECGKQLRPRNKCCQAAVPFGYRFCPECGSDIRHFWVAEEAQA